MLPAQVIHDHLRRFYAAFIGVRITASKARIDLGNIIRIPDFEDIHIDLRTIPAFFNKTRNQRKQLFVLKGDRLIRLSGPHHQFVLRKGGNNMPGKHIRVNIRADFLPVQELLNDHVRLVLKEEDCRFHILRLGDVQTRAAKAWLYKNRKCDLAISQRLFKRRELYIGFCAAVAMLCQPVIHCPFVKGHFTQLVGGTYNRCANSFKRFFVLSQKRQFRINQR